MRPTITVPTAHAESLRATVDAIRGETQALRAAGLIAVTADDLLDGGGTIHTWLAELPGAIARSEGGVACLPSREPGNLQHLVYALSAVLVWAHELRAEGRLATVLSAEALAAWNEVERVAGLGGRTAVAVGRAPVGRRRQVVLDDEPVVTEVRTAA